MMMPEIEIKTSRAIAYDIDIEANKVAFELFIDFEQLMIAKMFFTTGLKRNRLRMLLCQLTG